MEIFSSTQNASFRGRLHGTISTKSEISVRLDAWKREIIILKKMCGMNNPVFLLNYFSRFHTYTTRLKFQHRLKLHNVISPLDKQSSIDENCKNSGARQSRILYSLSGGHDQDMKMNGNIVYFADFVAVQGLYVKAPRSG